MHRGGQRERDGTGAGARDRQGQGGAQGEAGTGTAGRHGGTSHTATPPHGSTPHLSAGRGGALGKIPCVEIFLQNVNERMRYHSITPLCVTKYSEFSLLYDKPLSTPKPRLYITTLELLCKSYALGRLFGGG
jgi:hypothetical protein